jgi:hypothetical protein
MGDGLFTQAARCETNDLGEEHQLRMPTSWEEQEAQASSEFSMKEWNAIAPER